MGIFFTAIGICLVIGFISYKLNAHYLDKEITAFEAAEKLKERA
ncbi:hypothetical protein [Planomicrobium sp. MB-3u-38]|nr:hypothetical protein [Planomicrobium sp. MB-3u-38]